MKVNETTAIATDAVLLVPYEAHHVPRYHSWMQDPAIREATASEELSLAEEFDNQLSWRRAHDKLTFILCRPCGPSAAQDDKPSAVSAGQHDAEGGMLGDVNFFLYPHDDEETVSEGGGVDGERKPGDGEGCRSSTREVLVRGEVDVMVAEEDARGKGVGRAAVSALLAFVEAHLVDLLAEYAAGEKARWDCAPGTRTGTGLTEGDGQGAKGLGNKGEEREKEEERVMVRMVGLMVKIKAENEGSLRLFRALGFEQDGGVDYFGEVKMVLPWDRDPDPFEPTTRRWKDAASRLGYRELRYDMSSL